MSLERLTLVLNASYEPINVITARRAITLVMSGKAYVEAPSTYFVRTARLAVQIPSVIRLLLYRRMPRHNRAVSRKSIFLRDRYTCQYCHRTLPAKQLTLDHVIPRSRCGANSWENMVACCYSCNNRKADRTPQEAGMPLDRKPAQIGIHAKHRLIVGSAEPAWDRFLFC
jgi:5-methylcytosine-specific restriction endonuclease McrA